MSTRIFGPKAPDHPSVGEPCAVCHAPFKAGDLTILIPQEPDDDEERAKMLAGKPYTTPAVEAHAKHSATS